MSLATCPNREELAEYIAGKLSDDASDSLADHLDSCSDCQAVLATLPDAEDTLVAQLRQPQAEEPFLDEPQCDKAVARARALIGSTDAVAAQAEASTTLFPRQLGEYQLLERLGRGGMGTVYKARQGRLDRIVALKILARSRTDDSHAVVRFEREMKAIGRLDHPNIVKAYDAREIDGTLVLVMELIDGLDLAEIVRRVGPLPVADACEMIRQAALALQYAHEHGLVHRDIKPSNLMLNRQGEIKLLDLGLARLFVEGAPPSSGATGILPVPNSDVPSAHSEEMTGTGQAMGTADYMAPEQASDSRSVDIRADIYSLGCTFYKLLSGRAPFAGPDYRGTLDKMNAHVQETPPPVGQFVENLPPELENLLARMLAKDPADRFATPAEVAIAVGQISNLSNVGQICNLSSEVGQVSNLSGLLSTALSLPRESWAKADKSQDANVTTSRPKIQPVRRRPIAKRLLLGLGFFGAMAFCFAAGVLIKIELDKDVRTTVTVENKNEPAPTEKPTAKQPQVQITPTFRTTKITRGDLKYSVEVPVTIEPEASVNVQSKIEGTIVSLGPDPRGDTDPQYKGKTIDYGTPVEEGTILARIDARLLQLNVERETANVKRAETDYKIAKSKSESGLMPNEALSPIEAEIEKSKFALKEAEIRLADTIIKSPIKGVVIARFVNVGQDAQSMPTIFVVAKEFKKMMVRVSSMEQGGIDIGQVREGMPLTLTVDAFPDDKFAAKVTQIDKNSTSPIIVAIDNPDLKLTPGLKAKLHFELTDHNVLLVPNEAIVRKGTSTYLRIPSPNKAYEEVAVHAIRETDAMTEIDSSPKIKAGVTILIEDDSKPDAGNNANPPEKSKKKTFRTAKITRGDMIDTISLEGVVEPEEIVNFSPSVSGRISELLADCNAQVKQNDIVALLDKTEYQNMVEQEKIKVDRANGELDQSRLKQKVAEAECQEALESNKKVPGTVPQAEINKLKLKIPEAEFGIKTAEANLELAEHALKLAKNNLALTEIRSPIDGIVLAKNCQIGQNVSKDGKDACLFRIAKDLKKMKIRTLINEKDISRIKEGMEALISINAFPNKTFRGKLTRIHQTVGPDGALAAEISFDNPEKKILPYMQAGIKIVIESRKNVLLVPHEALTYKPSSASAIARLPENHAYLWLPPGLNGSTPESLEVQVGLRGTDNQVELVGEKIIEGLEVIVGETANNEKTDAADPYHGKPTKYVTRANQLPPAPSPVNPAAELKALQGQWKVVKQENGEAADTFWLYQFHADKIERMLFQQELVSLVNFEAGEFNDPWIFRIDPTSGPKKIDIVDQSGEGEVVSSGMGAMGSMGGMGGMGLAPGVTEQRIRGRLAVVGIYKVEGKQLIMRLAKYLPSLMTDQRPKNFAFEPKSGDIMLTLERYEPSKDESMMQGKWHIAHFVDSGGQKSLSHHDSSCFIDDFHIRISGESGGMGDGSVPYINGIFFLNEENNSKRITIEYFEPDPYTQTMTKVKLNGIFRIDDDGLTIAYRKNGEAPDKFESLPDSGVMLLELKKGQPKPEKKESPPTTGQAPAVNAANPAAELHAMQGAWKVAKMEKGKNSQLPDAQLVLVDGQACEILGMEWRDHLKNAYSLDPTKSPKTIDLRSFNSVGEGGELDSLGIYEFDGERLKLCLTKYLRTLNNDQRPKTLAIEPNSADASYLLEREKPSADFKLLQGYWGIDTELEEGKTISQVPRRHLKIFFEEHHKMVTWQGIEPGTPCGGVYLLDTTKTPARITMFVSELVEINGAYFPRSLALIGIYKVEKDRLTIAYRYGNAFTSAPEKFESTPDSGVKLLELKKGEPKANASPPALPSAEPIKPEEAKQADVILRDELTAINGDWDVESIEKRVHGKEPVWWVADNLSRLTFDSAALVTHKFKEGKSSYYYTFYINPTKNPKSIDFSIIPFDKEILEGLGIYKIEGDRMTIQITKNVPNYPPDDLRPKTFDLGPGSEDAVLHLRRFVPTAKEKALSGQWNVVAIHEDGKKLDSAITLDIPGIKPDGEAEVYHKQLLLPDALIFTNSHNQCDSWGKTGNAYGWSKYMLDASDDPEKIHFYTSNKAWYLRVKLQQGVMPGEPADNKTPLEFSGIYRIENDGKRLTIAFREGGAPPEKFESTPGSGVTLFELEKNESPKPEKKESSIVPLIPGK